MKPCEAASHRRLCFVCILLHRTDRKTTFVSILMRNVAYINSSGFGYFMDLAGMLERRGGALVLVEVQPKVKVVFNNLGMQNFFRLELSGEAAR